MTDNEDRTLGRLEAHVQDLRHDVRGLSQRVDALTALVEQGKGARWMMGIVGAIAGGLASFIAAALGLLRSQ